MVEVFLDLLLQLLIMSYFTIQIIHYLTIVYLLFNHYKTKNIEKYIKKQKTSEC